MKRISHLTLMVATATTALSAHAASRPAPASPLSAEGNWTTVGGNGGHTKYSALKQITPGNVGKLAKAWTFGAGGGSLTPVAVDGVLYYPSGSKVFAVDGDTGQMLWRADLSTLVAAAPGSQLNDARPAGLKVRGGPGAPAGAAPSGYLAIGNSAKYGVAYWPGTGKVAPRIVVVTSAGYLVQLNAKDGSLVKDFGTNGAVDLRVGIMENMNLSDYTPGALATIYKNYALITPRTSENGRYGTPGDPRAFDLLTGKMVWRVHVVPHPGEENFGEWGLDGWQDRRGAGSWVPMTVDPGNNLVFMATGNATDQDYGAQRPGSNLYATTILAIDGDTGKVRWHFQTTHHDIYDWDLNAPPVLIDVTDGSGARRQAVAQSSKSGYLYLLDRLTGKPILPVTEKHIPPTDSPGEKASPTQPIPTMGSIARVGLTRDEVANISPASHKFCLAIYDKAVQMGEGTPYGMEPSLVFPSSTGGPNTGGVTFDPGSNTMFVNVQNLGTIAMLTPVLSVGRYESLSKSKIPFTDPDGYPCSTPPWGEIMAIDAATGAFKWRKPLGEYKELTAKGVPPTGQIPNGGSIVTAGGVLFVGATADKMFRAIDPQNGNVIWSTELPGAGGSTPLTYRGKSGKQYVAITTTSGGPRPGTPGAVGGGSGLLVSFSVPQP